MENNCPICLIEMTTNINICTTECGHIFHLSCFLYIKDYRCPCCRKQLITKDNKSVSCSRITYPSFSNPTITFF